MLSVIERLDPGRLAIAAPFEAILVVNVSPESTSVWLFRIAPPKVLAAFCEKLEFATVSVPVSSLATPPPNAAVLPVTERFERLSTPELSMAPPLFAARPPVTVSPLIEAVTPAATENTPLALPPLIVSMPGPGPRIDFATLVPPLFASVSVPPVKSIVPVALKSTVFGAGLK